MLCAFDGTWATRDRSTNVALFADAFAARTSPAAVCYQEGIGTRFDDRNPFLKWGGRAIGGIFGAGEIHRLNVAYDFVCRRWAVGDRDIYIVGFSRGGASGLELTNVLAKRGIADPKTGAVVEAKPPIKFLGLWDPVGAFGLGAVLGDAPWANIGRRLRLAPELVWRCFIAYALDENRPSFNQLIVPGAYSVWFRGVHGDNGGGNGNVGLSHITLRWMLRKAVASGLPLTASDEAITDKFNPSSAPLLHSPRGVWPFGWRDIGDDPCMHYTVSARPDCRPIGMIQRIETEASEHISVGVPSEAKRAV